MAKQVEKTPAIIAQMQKIAGEGADVANLPVFEAQAANTLPINKRGSIYNKAKFSEGMVKAIADVVGDKGAPLHTLHQAGGELPIGRVFMGGSADGPDGLPTTNVLFWVDPTDAKMVEKVDNGTIESVSLGVLSEHALCSECGFDYFGDTADLMNWYGRTCENDHVIGEDGVHLMLTGQPQVFELSLVGDGAVQNSKIVSGSKAVVAGSTAQRLAASGADINALVLTASATIPKPQNPKEGRMADAVQLDGLIEKITKGAVDLASAQANLTASQAKVVDLEAQVAALTIQVTDLRAKDKTPAEVQEQLAAANADADAAKAFLKVQATTALTATSGDVSKVDAMSVAELTAAITDAQGKLATLFPVGGASLSATSTEDAEGKAKAEHRKNFKL